VITFSLRKRNIFFRGLRRLFLRRRKTLLREKKFIFEEV
jgi:hypothetical protein